MQPTKIQVAEVLGGIERASVGAEIEAVIRADRGARPPIAIVACNRDAEYWRGQFEKTVASMSTMAWRAVDAEAELGGWQLSTIAFAFIAFGLGVALALK